MLGAQPQGKHLQLSIRVLGGTRLTATPKAVLDAAWKAAEALYADLAQKNPQWKKIHASYASFLKAQAWNQAGVDYDDYLHGQLMKAAEAEQKARKSAPAGRHKAAAPKK